MFARLDKIIDWRAYLAAIAAVVVSAAARHVLDPWLGSNRPFLLFFVAVTFAAWYGGLWPAISAISLSYLVANIWFIEPYGGFNFDPQSSVDWTNLLSFLAISAVIVAAIEAMRRAQWRADASAANVQTLLDRSEEADRRKDEFLATLAHELRNPLAPLSNALQLWSMRAPDAAEAADLRAIMSRQVRQLARLIDDLMDVSRIKHGRIHLRRAPGQLRPLVEDAAEAARPLIDRFGHQLTVELPNEAIWLDADAARLTQVFTNLLINAAKHSGENCQIAIAARRAPGLAIISVRDNGVGIPTDMLTKIFEPFAQLEAGSERFYAGLGIGLALAKQLVELHGGTITAHSDGPGTGCEFVVSLPAVIGPIEPPPSLVPPPAAVPAAATRHKIVVADDIVESATTLAKMLEAMGQDVAVAHDGPSTIDTINTVHSDLAIVDIGMPGIDGYEVARRLRLAPTTRAMTLIALTGYGQEHDRARAMAAGFDYHLTKPVNLDQLEPLLAAR